MKTKTITQSGRLEGEERQGVAVFRGVPFATARAGSRRFRAPEAVSPWSGTRLARRSGPAAPQGAMLSRLIPSYSAVPAAGWAEDCLHAEVYTPGCDGRRRPVMIWIHGGGYSTGSGSFWIYDGARLARRGDVVVVAINYRMGVFGNLDLSWADSEGTDTNVGVRDQLAALRWVRDEIEAFGGDPENVTLFGQSAGAMSIGNLMAAPEAKGLFHRVILQSGALRHVHAPHEGRHIAEELILQLGLDPDRKDVVDEMRTLPAEVLLEAQQAMRHRLKLPIGTLAWQPTVDGDLLPRPPIDLIRRGEAGGCPMLIGVTRDEWKMFTAADARRRKLDEPMLRDYLAQTLERDDLVGRVDVDDLLDHYGHDRERGLRRGLINIWEAFQSDRVFRRPAIEMADAYADRDAPTWVYRFDRAPSVMTERVGACHSIELPFLFGTLRHPLLRAAFVWPPDALQLSDAMQDVWTSFAHRGQPNSEETSESESVWPRYRSGEGELKILGGKRKRAQAADDFERQFWERLTPAESSPAGHA
ncbi:MAG: carboxylesterase family protein [Myxococcota bacterium]|nr:carboxylesterase family protein [Myxococcota bacterium]